MNRQLSFEALNTLSQLSITGLVNKNIKIHNRRTSIRLEPEMWSALHEIAEQEGCSIHELCSAVEDVREDNTSFTAALRVFLMLYYKSNVVKQSLKM